VFEAVIKKLYPAVHLHVKQHTNHDILKEQSKIIPRNLLCLSIMGTI